VSPGEALGPLKGPVVTDAEGYNVYASPPPTMGDAYTLYSKHPHSLVQSELTGSGGGGA